MTATISAVQETDLETLKWRGWDCGEEIDDTDDEAGITRVIQKCRDGKIPEKNWEGKYFEYAGTGWYDLEAFEIEEMKAAYPEMKGTVWCVCIDGDWTYEREAS